jgi:hypothetical protein
VLTDEKLHNLFFSVDVADAAPTQQQYEVFKDLSGRADPLIAQWKQVLGSDVVALNDMMQKDNVPAIYLAPANGADQNGTKAAGEQQH